MKKLLPIDVGNQKPLWQGEKMHTLGVDCGKFFFLHLSHHCYNHPTKWNNTQNQISSSEIINDNIGHGVDAMTLSQASW